MSSYDVIIIGAGPSGMTAAIAASKAGAHVLLMDRADKIGKKILVTGNGRCNLTNEYQRPECYRSEHPERAMHVLSSFSYQDTHDFFRELGILTRNKSGYIYPYNEQAASVREAFETRIVKDDKIEVLLDTYVEAVQATKKGFLIRTRERKYSARKVIITTGGFAGPKIGCDGSGYTFAQMLGHEIVPTLPALTSLKSSAPFLKKASGVRNQAKITLKVEDQMVAFEQGELQWTDYGISGVAVFQLSRYAILALEEKKRVALDIDFLPEWDAVSCLKLLQDLKKQCYYKNISELFLSILPAKLIPILLREARIPENLMVGKLREEDDVTLCHALKHFTLRINGYTGYEKAQVTRGGVALTEVSDSLESIYHRGLFFAGEVLDVDGTCGGYNLQWAFSSGMIAGRSAARLE